MHRSTAVHESTLQNLGADNTAVIFTNDDGRETRLVAFFAVGPIAV